MVDGRSDAGRPSRRTASPRRPSRMSAKFSLACRQVEDVDQRRRLGQRGRATPVSRLDDERCGSARASAVASARPTTRRWPRRGSRGPSVGVLARTSRPTMRRASRAIGADHPDSACALRRWWPPHRPAIRRRATSCTDEHRIVGERQHPMSLGDVGRAVIRHVLHPEFGLSRRRSLTNATRRRVRGHRRTPAAPGAQRTAQARSTPFAPGAAGVPGVPGASFAPGAAWRARRAGESCPRARQSRCSSDAVLLQPHLQ